MGKHKHKQPGKGVMRGPRIRWTTSLHARFVHAVELLGGRQRATPKSVLELMNVEDLTVAQVKSHLQVYRNVQTAEKTAVSSGHSDGSGGEDISTMGAKEFVDEGGSPGNLSLPANSLWTNSSSCRDALLQTGSKSTIGIIRPSTFTLSSHQKSEHPTQERHLTDVMDQNNLSLEFTLGRSD